MRSGWLWGCRSLCLEVKRFSKGFIVCFWWMTISVWLVWLLVQVVSCWATCFWDRTRPSSPSPFPLSPSNPYAPVSHPPSCTHKSPSLCSSLFQTCPKSSTFCLKFRGGWICLRTACFSGPRTLFIFVKVWGSLRAKSSIKGCWSWGRFISGRWAVFIWSLSRLRSRSEGARGRDVGSGKIFRASFVFGKFR